MKTHLFPAMRSLAASAATVLFSATAVIAAIDDPSISGWSGTAYHPGGWFTYNMAKPEAAMKFSSGFLLSPLYSAPIRKVAVVAVSSEGCNKSLSIAPLANGVEGVAQVRALESSCSAQIIDFDPAEITEGSYDITFTTQGREYKVETTARLEAGDRVGLSFGPEDIHLMRKAVHEI